MPGPRGAGGHHRGPRHPARRRPVDEPGPPRRRDDHARPTPAARRWRPSRDDIEHAAAAAGFDASRCSSCLSPAWTTDWMTDAGRGRLREFGIAPPGAARRRGGGPVPLTLSAVPVPARSAAARDTEEVAPVRLDRVQGAVGAAAPAASPSTTSRRSDDAALHLAPGAAPRPVPPAHRGSASSALTDDAVAITFDVPESLRDDYGFEPGQHLTLRASIDGRGGAAVLLDLPLPAVAERTGTLRVAAARRRRRAGSRTGSTTPSRAGDVRRRHDPAGVLHRARPSPAPHGTTSPSPPAPASRRCSRIVSSVLEEEPGSRGHPALRQPHARRR